MVSNWRRTFREEYSWLLLPAFLVIAFTVDNRTGVTNFMRAFCFPLVLFALTTKDYKTIWANPAVRAFWLFIGWLNITLLWDGLSEKDWWFFQRNFHLFTLMGMVYLVCRQGAAAIKYSFIAFLLGGALYTVLVFMSLPEGYSISHRPIIPRESVSRGIFPISIYAAWMVMTLMLLSLYSLVLNIGKPLLQTVFLLAVLVFAYMVFVSQSQAAWIAATVGTFLLLIMEKRSKWVAAVCIVSVIPFFFNESSDLIKDAVNQADSYRLAIWGNAFHALASSPLSLLFGFGLTSETGNTLENYPAIIAHYHNFYINTLWYGGVIGLMLYAFLLLRVWKYLQVKKNSLLAVLILAMQVAFLVDGEHLFVIPSAMMLAYVLFLFFAFFLPEAQILTERKDYPGALAMNRQLSQVG